MKKLLLLFAAIAFAFSAMADVETITLSSTTGFSAVTITTAGAASTGADYEFSQGAIKCTGTYGYIYNKKHTVYKTGTLVIGSADVNTPILISSVEIEYNSACYPFAEAVGEGSTTSKTEAITTVTYTPSTPAATVSLSNASTGKTEVRKLVVTYTVVETAGPETPTITSQNATIITGESIDVSTLFNSNSNGAITYSVSATPSDDATYTLTGSSFTATTLGTYTILASQAADGTAYVAATKTATIKVVDTYVVTIDTPENGTLVIKNGDVVVNSGDEIAEGVVLTIVATPAEGYKLVEWTATDASEHTFGATKTSWTMGTHAVAFSASYTLIVEHNLTLTPAAGGTISAKVNKNDVTVADEGTVIDLMATPADGYMFVRWIVTGANVASNTRGTTVTMGSSDLTITAEFAAVNLGDLAYALTFNENGRTDGDNTSVYQLNPTAIFKTNASKVASVNALTYVYSARIGCGARFGKSSTAGKLDIDLAAPVNATAIVFNAAMYGAAEGKGGLKVVVNGETAAAQTFPLSVGNKVFEECYLLFDEATEIRSISIESAQAERFYLNGISFYGTELEYVYTLSGPDAIFADGAVQMTYNETDGCYVYCTPAAVHLAAGSYVCTLNISTQTAVLAAPAAPVTTSFSISKEDDYNIKFLYKDGQLSAVDPATGWATGLDNTEAQKVEKIFRNGQVVIIKNGVEYNVLGAKL